MTAFTPLRNAKSWRRTKVHTRNGGPRIPLRIGMCALHGRERNPHAKMLLCVNCLAHHTNMHTPPTPPHKTRRGLTPGLRVAPPLSPSDLTAGYPFPLTHLYIRLGNPLLIVIIINVALLKNPLVMYFHPLLVILIHHKFWPHTCCPLWYHMTFCRVCPPLFLFLG